MEIRTLKKFQFREPGTKDIILNGVELNAWPSYGDTINGVKIEKVEQLPLIREVIHNGPIYTTSITRLELENKENLYITSYLFMKEFGYLIESMVQ